MSVRRESERSTPPRLGDILEQHRDEILALWERRAREPGAARELSASALRDHVPDILEVIARSLASGVEPSLALGELPDIHALERLERGFDVGVAAAELSALRATVLDVWRSHGGEWVDVAEVALLDRALDEVIVRSVSRFAAARERTLVALDRVSSVALGTGRLHEFLPRLLAVLLETTGAADSAYILLADDAGVLHVRAAAGADAELSHGFQARAGEGFAGTVAQRREALLIRDASRDPLVRNAALHDRGVHALYGVPLVHEDRVIGVAKMASRSAYEFSEEDQQLFRVMAQRATSLIVQAKLVASRERALETLEHGDALFVLDPEWRVTMVNAAQERLSGRRREETLGRVFWELWPETASAETPYWREYHRCMRERVPVAFEAYHAPRDLWTEVTAHPMPDGGIAVFFRDASPRKRAEAELHRRESELQRVFAATPDLVCVATTEGRLLRVNTAFSAVLGFSEEELLRMPLLGIVHLEDRAVADEELRHLATGTPTSQLHLRCVRKDGEVRWVAWNASPDPEAPHLFVAVGRDITAEQRRVEFEQQLVAMVSHDLRNPLNAILLGASALLRREELDDVVVKGLTRLRSAAERAARMIADLLDFTRARIGHGIPVHATPMNLHALARDVVDEVQAAWPDRTLHVERSGRGEGAWDADRLAQVMTNLVANALQHGPQESPVTVRTRGLRSAVELEVHNGGPPIPGPALATLFQPYRRARSEARDAGSLGLGLYITEQIVLAHGGSIAVRSTTDEGTTFTVSLPRDASGVTE